ncbi:small acid-soluble spore protein Tlp [Tissierella sp. Yu-01]|uniref:small acid-soluble spore protein Tlp n=1 Tax=Tissierella sp. Yu-01 TaxID=3035694 RepID=UPI00240E49FF|nr:small acid-soluble spore protein Tlp [Tissierella sp. Yu-01]WFA08262.1 small acid-soluble spore protein Tlp [Tissierella sp. Yu-01]
MKNKPKPDDRRDNVEKIQYDINHTISNYRATKDLINETDDEEQKRQLEEKQKRRLQSLEGKRSEIREEAKARDNQYR